MIQSIVLAAVACTLQVSYVLAERPSEALGTADDFVLAPFAKQCPGAQVADTELPSSSAKSGWEGVWSKAQEDGKTLFDMQDKLREHGEGKAELVASLMSTHGGPLAPYAWGIAYLTKNVLFYVYCDEGGDWQSRMRKLIVAIKDATDKYSVFQSDKCGGLSVKSLPMQFVECGSAVTVSVMSIALNLFQDGAESLGLQDKHAPALALLTDIAASIQKLWTEGATSENMLDFVANFMRVLTFGAIVITTGSTDAWYLADAADNLVAAHVDSGIDKFQALLGDPNALSRVHGTPKSLDIKPLGEQCMLSVKASMLYKFTNSGRKFVLIKPEPRLDGHDLGQLDQFAFDAFTKSHSSAERTYEQDIVGRYDAWEGRMATKKEAQLKLTTAMLKPPECSAPCAGVKSKDDCSIMCDAAEWVCGSYSSGNSPEAQRLKAEGDSGWFLPTGIPPLSVEQEWQQFANM